MPTAEATNDLSATVKSKTTLTIGSFIQQVDRSCEFDYSGCGDRIVDDKEDTVVQLDDRSQGFAVAVGSDLSRPRPGDAEDGASQP